MSVRGEGSDERDRRRLAHVVGVRLEGQPAAAERRGDGKYSFSWPGATPGSPDFGPEGTGTRRLGHLRSPHVGKHGRVLVPLRPAIDSVSWARYPLVLGIAREGFRNVV